LFDQKFDLPAVRKVMHSFAELQTRMTRLAELKDDSNYVQLLDFFEKMEYEIGAYAEELDY